MRLPENYTDKRAEIATGNLPDNTQSLKKPSEELVTLPAGNKKASPAPQGVPPTVLASEDLQGVGQFGELLGFNQPGDINDALLAKYGPSYESLHRNSFSRGATSVIGMASGIISMFDPLSIESGIKDQIVEYKKIYETTNDSETKKMALAAIYDLEPKL